MSTPSNLSFVVEPLNPVTIVRDMAISARKWGIRGLIPHFRSTILVCLVGLHCGRANSLQYIALSNRLIAHMTRRLDALRRVLDPVEP